MSGWTAAMWEEHVLRLRKDDGSCMDRVQHGKWPIPVSQHGDKISAWLQGSFPPHQT